MIENVKQNPAPDITHFHEKQLATLRDANAALRHRIQDLEGRCMTLQTMVEGAVVANQKFEAHTKHLEQQISRTKDKVDPRSGPLGVQVGGDHYKKLGQYQPWEVAFAQCTPEELKGAMKLTVQAYLAREADKGGLDDIRKASHTLQIYLELEGRRNAVQGPNAAPECSGHKYPGACAQPGPDQGI